MAYEIEIKSRQPAVTSVVAGMEIWLKNNGLDDEQTAEVCLVVAEALNNVVEHAYRYAEDGDIHINLAIEGNRLVVNIDDFGPEFSIPGAQSQADPSRQALDALPEGGFGWNLIHMLTDKVHLKRKAGRNHLQMCKTVRLVQ